MGNAQCFPDLICDVNLVFVAFFCKFARGGDTESQVYQFNNTMEYEIWLNISYFNYNILDICVFCDNIVQFLPEFREAESALPAE